MACVWTDHNGIGRVEPSHWANCDWDCIGGCGRVLRPTSDRDWVELDRGRLMCPDCQAQAERKQIEGGGA
jgi:hypothetical protein